LKYKLWARKNINYFISSFTVNNLLFDKEHTMPIDFVTAGM